MKYLGAIAVFSLVAAVRACDVGQTLPVNPEDVLGKWYELKSVGDTLTDFFWKCMRNDVTLQGQSEIHKSRSSTFKILPFIVVQDDSILTNMGTHWKFTTQGLFGSKDEDFSIIYFDNDFMIIKTCPNGLFVKQTAWIYGKSNKALTDAQYNTLKAALLKYGMNIGDFTSVSQSNC